MQFTYDHALIPSGMYLQKSPEWIVDPVAPISSLDASLPLSPLDIELCNPMPVRPVESVMVEEVGPTFAAAFESELHRVPKIGLTELYNVGRNCFVEKSVEP